MVGAGVGLYWHCQGDIMWLQMQFTVNYLNQLHLLQVEPQHSQHQQPNPNQYIFLLLLNILHHPFLHTRSILLNILLPPPPPPLILRKGLYLVYPSDTHPIACTSNLYLVLLKLQLHGRHRRRRRLHQSVRLDSQVQIYLTATPWSHKTDNYTTTLTPSPSTTDNADDIFPPPPNIQQPVSLSSSSSTKPSTNYRFDVVMNKAVHSVQVTYYPRIALSTLPPNVEIDGNQVTMQPIIRTHIRGRS